MCLFTLRVLRSKPDCVINYNKQCNHFLERMLQRFSRETAQKNVCLLLVSCKFPWHMCVRVSLYLCSVLYNADSFFSPVNQFWRRAFFHQYHAMLLQNHHKDRKYIQKSSAQGMTGRQLVRLHISPQAVQANMAPVPLAASRVPGTQGRAKVMAI